MHPMEPIDPDLGIVYDKTHFVTRIGEVQIDEILAHIAVEQITSVEDRYREEPGFTLEEIEVDLWRVEADAPVLEAISLLRLSDIDARPVYCFGLEGHWSLEPGSEAAHRHPIALGDRQQTPLPEVENPGGVETLAGGSGSSCHVAVIDAGFSDILPPSISGSPYGEIDDHEAARVHGTVVASLIALAAPQCRIDYVRVVGLSLDDVQLSGPHWRRQDFLGGVFEFFCTDDLAVAAALRKAAEAVRPTNDDRSRYVNLSLGTYVPALASSGGFNPATESAALGPALDFADKCGVKVVAAAGNDVRGPASVFYPACRPDVLAVGAADELGDPIMWDHGNRQYMDRSWVNVLAPGIDLITPPYEQRDRQLEALRWSGSSFAAAIATGYFAAGNPVVPQIAYTDVSGLTYLGLKRTP